MAAPTMTILACLFGPAGWPEPGLVGCTAGAVMGGKVQGLTQTAVAQFAHPGTAGERARLALTGRDAGEGRQLAGVVQLINLRDNGQGRWRRLRCPRREWW